MKTYVINGEESIHAERMLADAHSQASNLIEKAITHSAEIIKKANLQAISLINQANIQAEQLINAANLNEKKLLMQADSNEMNLLKKANSSEYKLLRQANSHEKNLVKQAEAIEKILVKDANTLAKKVTSPIYDPVSAEDSAMSLVMDAGVNAKDLLDIAAVQAKELIAEADEQARGLVNSAGEQAKDLVSEADVHAKDLVKDAALQAKDLVKVAAYDARDLVIEASEQTKDLVKEAATQAKELITEAAKIYIENKMNFLNSAAHELRTPVTSINFALELAEKQVSKHTTLTIKFLNHIRSPLNRLSRLLSDLIDMCRMERKFVMLRLKKTNIVSLIEDCVEEFRIQNPDFVFNFSKPDRNVEVNLDPLRIHQVLSNIIENAVKYSGENMFEISLKILPESARVEVSDSGVGISKELQATLFLPFQRGTSDSNTASGGLGLGLSLCHEIIKLHKGTIGLVQSERKGCTFYFELPLDGRTK